jgi:hypothetical protein
MAIEDSPAFQDALKQACDSQWRNWLYGGGFKKSQRKDVEADLNRIQEIKDSAEAKAEAARREAEAIRAKAEALRQQHDPSLRRITENLRIKHGVVTTGLMCPKCKDTNASNVQVYGKGKTRKQVPWCIKCNVPLVPPDKPDGGWIVKQGNLDDVRRRLRGLP